MGSLHEIELSGSPKFLGYVDIMGFKEKLFRNGHKAAVNDILTVARSIAAVDAYQKKKSKEKGLSASRKKIQAVNFSDSVLGVTDSNTKKDADYIIKVFSKYFVDCLSSGIPIKGAMAFGLFTGDFKKNIFCGVPLVDAYLLGEEIGLYGIVLHHTFEKKLQELNLLDQYIDEKWIVEYPVPFKTGGKAKHYCINWLTAIAGKDSTIEVKEKVEEFYKTSSGKIRVYVDNTIDFMNHCHSLPKPLNK